MTIILTLFEAEYIYYLSEPGGGGNCPSPLEPLYIDAYIPMKLTQIEVINIKF